MPILADAFLENSGTLTFDDSEVIFTDSSTLDWFLVVWPFQKYFLFDVVVSIEFDYFLSNTSLFYINEAGGKDILVLNSSGDKVAGVAKLIESRCSLDSRPGYKSFRITIRYSCNHPTFRVGLYSAHGYHQGSGYNKLIITSISVLESIESSVNQITLVDVGARDGIQSEWSRLASKLNVIAFEPDDESASDIEQSMDTNVQMKVLNCGLWDSEGVFQLNICRLEGCSSLLEPNFDILKSYSLARCFEVMRTVPVRCVRYDSLYKQMIVPAPDVIKADVQGGELNVLKGFGDLLSSCIGIEIESHFYPFYKGQPLLQDIIEYLSPYGFVLRRLQPQMSFDEVYAEVNAFFTRRRSLIKNEASLRKLSVVESVWLLGYPEDARALLGSIGIFDP